MTIKSLSVPERWRSVGRIRGDALRSLSIDYSGEEHRVVDNSYIPVGYRYIGMKTNGIC